ncbi:MAG: hypothetical protein IT577_23745 [Verrucomicrobiae bacterium]|nr:hypothetical protein [Verrucomicrobiae bacterium]
MATTPHVRNIRDYALESTKALPAAGANVNCAAIDMEAVTGGRQEGVEFELAVPATPSLVEAKVITFKVQDSADNVTFADIDPLISTTVTGQAAAAGGAAKTVRFRLPSTARRYIAVNAAIPADGGDNTAVSSTLALLG